jgi:DNA invertase Pin-like site-specific DNA recombinase
MKTEEKISKLRKQLHDALNARPRRRKPRQKSDRPQGRPRIDEETIYIARELAKEAPIADVAFKLGVGLTTLKRYGITRHKLEAEKNLTAATV